ncbi:hypothetical protein [Legionella drancourtii]|uniref:Uncharacterized protein n=1 Tax=Legionella drancourtii LLAP12 TaxID=658187 RepID=G9EQJ1_9GAMM|nr:hypothetical protein [Legionella drancourtii]EHL30437.1 hypothetical protein LDG_7538 [Legionella drancourtii LLAP12]
MNKKDRENEYVGIISIFVIVILAVVLIYYFYLSHPSVSNVPVEAPTLQTNQTGGAQ